MPSPPAPDTAAASLPPAMPSIGAQMTGCLMLSRSVNLVDRAMLANLAQRLNALTWHQLIGVFPAGKRAHALAPGMDIGVALRPVVAVLFLRIEHVAGQGKVRDRRLVGERELGLRQMPVEDARGGIEPRPQERQHARVSRLRCERFQEAVAGEIAGELMIIE